MIALPGRHDRRLRPGLGCPGRPRRAVRRQRRESGHDSEGQALPRPRPADHLPVLPLPRAPRRPPGSRSLLVQPRKRQHDHQGHRTGDRLARPRQHNLLADACDPAWVLSHYRPRSLLDGAGMTFVLIGISAHPNLDRADLRLLHRLSLGAFTPISNCAGLLQSAAWATRQAGAVGLPPVAAVADVHDPLRRAVHPDDPGERDGDDERLRLRPRGAAKGAPERTVMRNTSCGTRCCRS